MRSWAYTMVLAVALGCSPSPAPATDAGVTDIGHPPCALTVMPSGALALRPSQQVNLRAAAVPAVPGTEVRFGLLGSAQDGSLTDTRAVTDASGVATVGLIAPSSSASFRLRASLACGAEAYVDVSVGDQGFGALAITAAYRGAREPTGVSVALYRAADCASLGGAVPDRVATLPAGGGMVQFSGLPAGLVFSVRGVATGMGGAALASGCAGPLVVMAGQTATADLLFTDAPLAAARTYDVALALDLSGEGNRAAPQWAAPVAAATAVAGGDGVLVAADVAAAVESAAPAGRGPADRAAFEAAFANHLATEVTAELAGRDLQVSAAFQRVAQQVAGVVASARAAAVLSLGTAGNPPADGGTTDGGTGSGTDASADGGADGGVGPLEEGPVDQVQYTLDPGTPDVHTDDVSVVLDGAGRGRITPGLGDGVGVSLEAVPLPYSRLAATALAAVMARLGVDSSAEYVALSVCPVVVAVLRPATGSCNEACVTAACRAAVARVGSSFDAAVQHTESSHTAVDLHFSGMAHAPAGSLAIDRVTGAATGAFRDDATDTVTAVAALTAHGGP